MLGDISTPEAVERERRSVTMLPTGTPVYDREEALTILEALLRSKPVAGTPGAHEGHRTPIKGDEP